MRKRGGKRKEKKTDRHGGGRKERRKKQGRTNAWVVGKRERGGKKERERSDFRKLQKVTRREFDLRLVCAFCGKIMGKELALISKISLSLLFQRGVGEVKGCTKSTQCEGF